jgi:type IV pilus assembly protein PilX
MARNLSLKLPLQARGAALFISLMFLIVLTLIGLSAANVGIMQERMAGNVRETNEAFQNAEATLREIEEEVRIIVQGGGGSLGSIPVFAEAQADLGISRSNCTLSEAASGDWPWAPAPSTNNDYVIYQITDTMDPVSGLPFGSACAPMFDTGDTPTKPFDNVYVIGSRAVGPAGTGEVVVQSIFNW